VLADQNLALLRFQMTEFWQCPHPDIAGGRAEVVSEGTCQQIQSLALGSVWHVRCLLPLRGFAGEASMETAMNSTTDTAMSFDATCDEGFVPAAKSGDPQAFEIIVKRYEPKIFAVALRYARVAEDAEDIVQQTFQKAFLHLQRFEGKSSFSTWLTRIAINEALMLLRRNRALREVSLEGAGDTETVASFDVPDSGPDPEADYLERERVRVLSAAVKKLPVTLRSAIELREFAEMSTRETAQRMGLSTAAVKGRIFHGKKRLRRALRRFGLTHQSGPNLAAQRVAAGAAV
jgi:RNA polymerase sigma-70 factor, ECF subfamily